MLGGLHRCLERRLTAAAAQRPSVVAGLISSSVGRPRERSLQGFDLHRPSCPCEPHSRIVSSNELTEVPPDLWTLTSVTQLNLAANHIAELGADTIGMPSLTELNLEENELKALPDSLSELGSLKVNEWAHRKATSHSEVFSKGRGGGGGVSSVWKGRAKA